MRGFLRNLGQGDEDRNTDGRKCRNSEDNAKEGLLAHGVTANSCRVDGLCCYKLVRDLHRKNKTKQKNKQTINV